MPRFPTGIGPGPATDPTGFPGPPSFTPLSTPVVAPPAPSTSSIVVATEHPITTSDSSPHVNPGSSPPPAPSTSSIVVATTSDTSPHINPGSSPPATPSSTTPSPTPSISSAIPTQPIATSLAQTSSSSSPILSNPASSSSAAASPSSTVHTSSNSTTIAAAVGGTLGGIFLLAILYIIYLQRQKRRHVEDLLQDVHGTTSNEPMSHEKQVQFDDIANSPPLISQDHPRTLSSSTSPSGSRQLQRSTSPQSDISSLAHLSPSPLVIPEQRTMTTPTTNTSPIAPHTNTNTNTMTNAQEEAELIRHLYTLNIPTPDIAQLVEGMRMERERLTDRKLRDGAGVGAGSGAIGSLSRNVQSTRMAEEAPPPGYDFK